MDHTIRRSAVAFDAAPVKTEARDHWSVVLEYEDEGEGPYVVDLSHRPRWDLQDAEIDGVQSLGIRIPDKPGRCVFEKGFLINRMNRTQASVWHLSGETPALPDDPAFTDVTDSAVFLAVFGPDLFGILEKLSALDFLDPLHRTPFLLQGPFSHLPCQIVTLDKAPGRSGILMTCSRGYARDMVGAILDAGREFKLRPAGEQAFSSWLAELG
ncbi:MAG: sarcosine oxidase subunit gamma SoxG [Desulfobacteraceae bacterium]|nr:sarcosine oxidase subunit gamma SoxG [Desulfobacteraceae bacterium]